MITDKIIDDIAIRTAGETAPRFAIEMCISTAQAVRSVIYNEGENIRESAERLWDGVTDILSQEQIDKLERLYRKELELINKSITG